MEQQQTVASRATQQALQKSKTEKMGNKNSNVIKVTVKCTQGRDEGGANRSENSAHGEYKMREEKE
jgi:hypothetical protein